MANYFDHLLFFDTPLHSRTDSQALRAEYCIVGIPHNAAIVYVLLFVSSLNSIVDENIDAM